MKKQEGVKMAKKKSVLLRSYVSQPEEELRNTTVHQLGMGIFWVALAVVCGGLGWVLLTILLK